MEKIASRRRFVPTNLPRGLADSKPGYGIIDVDAPTDAKIVVSYRRQFSPLQGDLWNYHMIVDYGRINSHKKRSSTFELWRSDDDGFTGPRRDAIEVATWLDQWIEGFVFRSSHPFSVKLRSPPIQGDPKAISRRISDPADPLVGFKRFAWHEPAET